jgi:hypothetical protein
VARIDGGALRRHDRDDVLFEEVEAFGRPVLQRESPVVDGDLLIDALEDLGREAIRSR